MSIRVLRASLAAIALVAVVAPALGQDRPPLPCAEADKACLLRAIQDHSIRSLESWRDERALALAERVFPAPARLVEYLHLDNILNGYPERPRPARPDPAFLADVKGAIAGLPPQVLRLFESRLAGVFLVDELGGTGYTDFLADASGKSTGGYVVLDAAVLAQRSANQWATWKENTPFKPDGVHTLQARIEDNAHDNRRNAIRYILLHELGHVLSIGGDIHPPWEIAPKDTRWFARYPFFDLAWKLERWKNRFVSIFDADFPQRKDVAYYFGAKLQAADMEATYAAVERTNFPSLYAATRPGDDFAESFASYVHVVLEQRPWLVTISRNGEVVKTFKACWDEPRCAAKRALLEQVLASP